jgi:hypothetical protein
MDKQAYIALASESPILPTTRKYLICGSQVRILLSVCYFKIEFIFGFRTNQPCAKRWEMLGVFLSWRRGWSLNSLKGK